MKWNNKKKISIAIVLIVIAVALGSDLLFSFYDQNTVDLDGITCNYNSKQCYDAIPTESTRVGNQWKLYYDRWDDWTEGAFKDEYKNFFYNSWEVESARQYEFEGSSLAMCGGNNICYKYPSEEVAQNLQESANQDNIDTYGIIDMFKPEYKIPSRGGPGWYAGQGPGAGGWREGFFGGKLCWVELDGDIGLIKFYGKTSQEPDLGGFHLTCFLAENPEVFSLNDHTVERAVIDNYIQRGARQFPKEAFNVKFDFSKTEYPTIGSPQICNPGEYRCSGETYEKCNSEGTGWDIIKICSNYNQLCDINKGGCYSCVPSCSGKSCGADDGCGSPCQTGTCTSGKVCQAGQCISSCTPSCSGKVCGSDGCNGTCGTCSSGHSCSNYQCVLDENCGNGICSSSENCGTCPLDCGCGSGKVCQNNQCITQCTPQCPSPSTITCGSIINPINGCGTCSGKGTKCSTGTCSNGQCVSNGCPSGQELCSDGICRTICVSQPTGNWYDFFLKEAFVIFGISIKWWMVIALAIAVFLFIR